MSKAIPVIRVSNEKLARVVKMLTQQRISFTHKQVNETNTIYSSIGNYTSSDSNFPAGELNFIKQVKKHIIENGVYNSIDRRFTEQKDRKTGISYFKYNSSIRQGTIIKDCVEVDLNSAYWECAYKLGLISEETYWKGRGLSRDLALERKLITKNQYDLTKGMTWKEALIKGIIDQDKFQQICPISKRTRLAALGSLAKVVKTFEFDGTSNKQKLILEQRSELTEHLWDEICYQVGKVMNSAAKECGPGFIFFWVDAIFIRKNCLKKVQEHFKDAGYEYKIEKCSEIEFLKHTVKVTGKSKVVEVAGKLVESDVREFNLSVPSK